MLEYSDLHAERSEPPTVAPIPSEGATGPAKLGDE
ncbi:hypothetical protein AIIKEEIJ_00376 [Rhodococcus sp. YH1]|nr:hypothetical protein [Rhodococcus sp. YH1]